ncbi:hypothetical protein P3G55_24765 [Leptospira sp. 96542]|nr:hypothetical protein [Leptospira sp. 96542]
MRSLVNLKGTRRQAFVRGLMRGLASPAMIFSTFNLPEEAIPKEQKVDNPAARTDGMGGDWIRVGRQLKDAIKAEASTHG